MVATEGTKEPQPSCEDVSTEALATDSNSGLAFYQSEKKKYFGSAAVIIVVAIAALLLSSYGYQKINKVATFSEKAVSSCSQIFGPTGVYKIKADTKFDEFPVYCDMDTDGGGWTLVAAIHENNINGKCTVGDKWSSDQGYDIHSVKYNGSKNWENKNIFGTIFSLTNDDYKNLAYYAVQAKNVMIWHVPNGVETKDISEKAFLKYYTTNNFLLKYGGNLQALFSIYTPLVHAGSNRFFILLAPPVVYEKGNNHLMMKGIPNSMRDFVEPGYIQFRSFDSKGFPNALCPGIRMAAGDSAMVCVGGGGLTAGSLHGYTRKLRKNYCGDFAGWGGAIGDPGLEDFPSDTGKSQKDINSSILVFVR